MTELLLYAAARAQLVKENIKPALSAGKAVIADRFVDSSAVYQGIGRGLGIDTVYKVNEFALQGILPGYDIFNGSGCGSRHCQKEKPGRA